METSVNNKCKAFTSLEQSRKLAEILPLESADMCYIKHASSDNPTWEFNEDFPPMILGNVSINEITVETLPCWSLAALLRVLPEKYTELIKEVGMYRVIKKDSYMTCLFDNPIDACYEMILKLHGLNLL